MPLRIEIPITAPEGKEINHSWGSLLHGFFMGVIPQDLAGKLHQCSVCPWTQFVRAESGNHGVWAISTMSDEMEIAVLRYLLPRLPGDIYLRQKGFQIHLDLPSYINKIPWQDLDTASGDGRSIRSVYSLELLTPTAFKQSGKYVSRPDLQLIYNSLAWRWNVLSPDTFRRFDLESETRERFEKENEWTMQINHPIKFSVDNHEIGGFTGNITARPLTTDEKNTLYTLFRFAEFAGIGIKTAIGMGGIFLENAGRSM